MDEYADLKFNVYGVLISVKEIKKYPPDFERKLIEMIQNYYIRIRHYTCDLYCGAKRDYETVLNQVNKEHIIKIMPELTANHIDFILKRIKVLNPLLK